MRKLNLEGGFPDYIMTLDGKPFSSRLPVISHSKMGKNVHIYIRKRLPEEPKPKGRT